MSLKFIVYNTTVHSICVAYILYDERESFYVINHSNLFLYICSNRMYSLRRLTPQDYRKVLGASSLNSYYTG